jgi:hypothetical protein
VLGSSPDAERIAIRLDFYSAQRADRGITIVDTGHSAADAEYHAANTGHFSGNSGEPGTGIARCGHARTECRAASDHLPGFDESRR